MSLDLSGRTAFITGAATGIGRACALTLSRHGAAVLLADIDAAGLDSVVAEITSAGGSAAAEVCDVTREADVARAVNAARSHFGGLDIGLNNAATVHGFGTDLHTLEERDWDINTAVNLKGVFFCLKHEVRQMLEGRGGVIVNISSAVAFRTAPRNPAYGASKAAVVNLTRSLAIRYAHRGIRANCVCPGVIDTPLSASMRAKDPGLERAQISNIPLARIGEPQNVADAVAWLVSDMASYITGVALPVDGGWCAT